MSQSIAAREALWDAFLQRWPLERLPEISLAEYSTAGDDDCFVYWLESRTEELGSIWGGSAFKFGIYSRKSKKAKSSNHKLSYDEHYAWYSKYGSSPQAAFEQVRQHLVTVAQAARQGDFAAIDKVDLGQAFKWKLAFLYQDLQAPQLLPIYKPELLAAYLGHSSIGPMLELQKAAAAQRGEENLFAFGEKIWTLANQRLNADSLKAEDALAFFQTQGELFSPIKAPTQYLAGFQTAEGKQLAVVLNSKSAKLWLEPGDWLAAVQGQLQDIEQYPPERPRNSNLTANAPALAVGQPAILVTLPNRAALLALADAYTDLEAPENQSREENAVTDSLAATPLNQILYGPPGTGKTYATIDHALAILDPEFLRTNGGSDAQSRARLKARFDELVRQDRIRFVTFHQSFSYEDFVEGLRATSDEASGQLRYEVVDGVFKSLCEAAAAKVTQQAEAPLEIGQRRVWKMSLGNTLGEDASIYQECLASGYVLLGYGGNIDFSGCSDRRQVQERFASAGISPENPATDYGITSVTTFVTRMKVGDLVVVSDGNFKFRAIGEITGDYQFRPHPDFAADYSQMRPVKWLRQYQPSLPHSELLNAQFSQMTLYELRSPTLDREKLKKLLHGPATHSFVPGQKIGGDYSVVRATDELLELRKPNGNLLPFAMSLLNTLADSVRAGKISLQDIRDRTAVAKLPDAKLEPYLVNGYYNILPALVEHMLGASQEAGSTEPAARVLIIDEINRGNVSRIFGELISLIEPSKRAGREEALSVVLPYSKQSFSVPSNLYLIGTMNTADRSLAGLDIALRRRFSFCEMPPRPDLLDGVTVVEGGKALDIGQLLRVLNQRIEVLLDRDHRLGHAYFMPLKDDPSLARLEAIFTRQILPLLQEYFFEDWERISWVLNDHLAEERGTAPFLRKPHSEQALSPLFGKALAEKLNDQRWELNPEALASLDSYRNILS
ncbi:AAA family ATPase [Zestomonas thermotolerans]|uniref:AAA family ATPase n=1 Tax=Zestomonas thermotolerans TaxID=157784 RepID=UPI000485DDE9|nr:AAA family ATPase [Pseudomonas thermotolerans]